MIYDAVIVGAGPAGSTAAHALAAGGARAALVERSTVPRYKVCGGGVVARALPLLPAGLRLEPEREIRAVEWNLPDTGLRTIVRQPEPIIVMTMRDRFDLALVRAADAAGAEIRTGCEFRGFEDGAGGLVVHTDRGSLSTRYLIGADGAAGRVARHAGWPDCPAGIPALECELEVDRATLDRFAATARFDIGFPAGGYSWVFPKRHHLSVGILYTKRRSCRLKEHLAAYLRQLGIDGSTGHRARGHAIPVVPRAGGVARGRVLLAGDAAGLADPLLCEGITNAVRSGKLAAKAVLSGRDPAATGRAYALGVKREILSELRVSRFLAEVLYRRPRLRNHLLRTYGQASSEALVRIITGRSTYRELFSSPGNYWKLLASRGRRRPAAAPPG